MDTNSVTTQGDSVNTYWSYSSKHLLISVLAFVGVLLGAPCGAQTGDTRDALCKRLPTGNTCTAATARFLSEPPPRGVLKQGKTLTVIPKDGKKKTWQDGEGETGVRYESSGFIEPHKYFWISGFFYEGQSHELVSYENGSSYQLEGFPLLSPDGAHFLVQVTPYGADPQALRIYSINRKEIAELAKFDITHVRHVGQPLWLNSAEIVLLSSRYDPAATTTFTGPPILVRIRKRGADWIWVEESRN